MRRGDPGLFPWPGCPDQEVLKCSARLRGSFGASLFPPGGLTLPANFKGMLHSSQLVPQMIQSPQRMMKSHLRAGKAHHVLRHLPLSWLITVDRTIRAGWLVRSVGTLLKPPLRVTHESGTLRTEAGSLVIAVVMITINSCHADKGVVFALQSAGEPAHGPIIEALSMHHSDPNQVPGKP